MRLVAARSKVIRAALIVGTSVCCLTGCDTTIFWGPMTIQRDGAHLLVAVCQSIDVIDGFASESNEAESVPWHRFWNEEGSTFLSKGTIFRPADGIKGLSASLLGDPSMSAGSDIAVTLNAVRAEDGLSGEFVVGAHGLSETTWLHPDGSRTKEPCDAADRRPD
jgi:hypothetical protein